VRFQRRLCRRLSTWVHCSGQNASTATTSTKRNSATAICIIPNCGASFAILFLPCSGMHSPIRANRYPLTTITGAQRASGQTYSRARSHQGDADLRADRSTAYLVSCIRVRSAHGNSLDHRVGTHKKRGRKFKAKRPCGACKLGYEGIVSKRSVHLIALAARPIGSRARIRQRQRSNARPRKIGPAERLGRLLMALVSAIGPTAASVFWQTEGIWLTVISAT